VLKQMASTGYLRKRLPQELVVLQGGGRPSGRRGAPGLDPWPRARRWSRATAWRHGARHRHGQPWTLRTKAKMQGYEGDPCGECGNYTLVRNGTCMKCNTCGGTSGCS
jgi:ribonucleoside-diphosphate reductase alpha chain